MQSPRTSGHVQSAESESVKRPYRAGRPTAHQLELRKLRIVEVASAMFGARGYAETAILDIAREAGVATRTVSEHFGDKEQLFRTVIALGSPHLFEPLSIDESSDARTSLIAYARNLHAMILTKRVLGHARLIIAESARFPEMMSQAGINVFQRMIADISELFRGLATRRLIPATDFEESAELFLDIIIGGRVLMTICGPLKTANSEEEIERRVDLFLKGWFGQ
jgi:TetR/AcrR family transcriptional repressor of mexJK operon